MTNTPGKLLSTRFEQIKQDIEGGNLIVEEAITLLGEAIKNTLECSHDTVFEEEAFNDFVKVVDTAIFALLDYIELPEHERRRRTFRLIPGGRTD